MIDGCSRLVTGYASMPVKNPILVYEFAFRPACTAFGIKLEWIMGASLTWLCQFIEMTGVVNPINKLSIKTCYESYCRKWGS